MLSNLAPRLFERHYPCIRQTEQKDCGVAAVASIARFHGVPFEIETLKLRSALDSKSGATLAGLEKAAESLGYRTWVVTSDEEGLAQIPLPAIARVERQGAGHYLVIHEVKGSAIVVADPASGVSEMLLDVFLSQWSGHLLLAELQEDGPRPCSPRYSGIWALLRSVTVANPISMSVAAASAASIVGLRVGWPFGLTALVQSATSWKGFTLLLLLGFVGLAIARVGFSGCLKLSLAGPVRTTGRTMRTLATQWIAGAPPDLFEQRSPGELADRVEDTERIRRFLGNWAPEIGIDTLLPFVILLVLVWVDFRAAGFLVVLLAILGWAQGCLQERIERANLDYATSYRGVRQQIDSWAARVVGDSSARQETQNLSFPDDKFLDDHDKLLQRIERSRAFLASLPWIGWAAVAAGGSVVLFAGEPSSPRLLVAVGLVAEALWAGQKVLYRRIELRAIRQAFRRWEALQGLRASATR